MASKFEVEKSEIFGSGKSKWCFDQRMLFLFGFFKWTKKKEDRGQNLTGYVSVFDARPTYATVEHRLPLWDVKLGKTYDSNCSR